MLVQNNKNVRRGKTDRINNSAHSSRGATDQVAIEIISHD